MKASLIGTLEAPPQYLSLIETGSIELTTVLPPFLQKYLSLYLMVLYTLPGSEVKSLSVYQKIVLEDPTSSPILANEALERNIKLLSFVSLGPNAIISCVPINFPNDIRRQKWTAPKKSGKILESQVFL